MELFVILILVFLGGATCYGLAQLATGARDLLGQLRVWLGRPVALRDAREGRVLLRGRARQVRKLLPGLTGSDGCVTSVTRSGLGVGRCECTTVFEICDDTGVARIEAQHVDLVAPDASDVFGGLTREVRPGDEILVVGRLAREIDLHAPGGSYREPPTALVVRDDAEHGVQIVRPTKQPVATLGKGAFALGLATLGLWVAIALMI